MELPTDSSRALLCSSAFVLLLLSSASTDESIREHDVSSDRKVVQMPVVQVRKEPPNFPSILPSDFRPSSFPDDAPQYPVQFPVARPSADNIHAICLHGDHRPQYQDSYFPTPGYGHHRRQANAVNYAESWFSMCCRGNETWGNDVTLCCATQAWEKSVQTYCEENVSIKAIIYNCCMMEGSNRLNCFHSQSPNPSYGPTEELPVTPTNSSLSITYEFNFERSTCQSSAVPDSNSGLIVRRIKRSTTSQKIDTNVSPGRATADSTESHNMTSVAEEPSLSRICDTLKIIKKKFSVWFVLKSFVSQCCPLPDQDKTTCFTQKLEELPQRLCESKKPANPALRRCCLLPSQDVPQCITKVIMDAVTESSNAMR